LQIIGTLWLTAYSNFSQKFLDTPINPISSGKQSGGNNICLPFLHFSYLLFTVFMLHCVGVEWGIYYFIAGAGGKNCAE
jgi:hypothetical protein